MDNRDEKLVVGLGAAVTAILAVPMIKLQKVQINWYDRHPVATVILSVIAYFAGYYGTKAMLEKKFY